MNDPTLNKARRTVLEAVCWVAAVKTPPPDRARIYHDLFIGGDDADEMLELLAEGQPGLFRGMEFNTYFPNEHETFGLYWKSKFGYRDERPELTVGHLIHVVEQGRWFDPPSPGAEA